MRPSPADVEVFQLCFIFFNGCLQLGGLSPWRSAWGRRRPCKTMSFSFFPRLDGYAIFQDCWVQKDLEAVPELNDKRFLGWASMSAHSGQRGCLPSTWFLELDPVLSGLAHCFINSFDLHFVYMDVSSVCKLCITQMPGALRSHKRALDSVQVESQMLMSRQMSPGNWTLVFWK